MQPIAIIKKNHIVTEKNMNHYTETEYEKEKY